MRTRTLLATASLFVALSGCDGGNTVTTSLQPAAPSYARASAPAATFFVANDAAYLLRGDGAYVDLATGASRYANGECGVSSVIYALSGGTGDATMNTGSTGRCLRRVRIDFAAIGADGSTTSEGSITTSSFLNVRKLHVAATSSSPAIVIPIGTDAQRTFAFDDGGTKCGTPGTAAIAFDPVLSDGTVTNADYVNVHRDAADTWTVTTQPDEIDPISQQTIHHDRAYCRGNGKLYHMPLKLTIRSSVPLTP